MLHNHMHLINMIWVWSATVLAIVVCGWALWRGGAAERWGAVILLVGWALTMMMQSHTGHGPGTAVVVIDTVCLIAFVALSLWSRRLWTIFMAAFQLDAVMSHFAVGLSGHIDRWAYVTALGIWGGYGLVFALAAGMIWPLPETRALRQHNT